MLWRVTLAVCSEMNRKHIKTLCGHNLEMLNIKLVLHIVTTGFKELNTRYKTQSVNAVYGNFHCLFSYLHKTLILCGHYVELFYVKLWYI